MSLAIGKCNEYLKEVIGHVHDVVVMHLVFKYKLQVLN